MKKMIFNIAIIAIVSLSAVSCKDSKKEGDMEAEEAAVATEMASDYNVDTSESQITWKGAKPLGEHTGTILLASGTISLGNDMIEAGDFVLDMTSIGSTDLEGEQKANLDAHLKGTVEGKEGDFFNVNKYPTAKFELTDITEKGGKQMVNGNLTIKDKTKNVQFPATISMDGDKLMINSEPFNLDRTQWDVNYGSKSVFDNLGDKFISDDMEITVSIVANKV